MLLDGIVPSSSLPAKRLPPVSSALAPVSIARMHSMVSADGLALEDGSTARMDTVASAPDRPNSTALSAK